jgi:hypothetical protein
MYINVFKHSYPFWDLRNVNKCQQSGFHIWLHTSIIYVYQYNSYPFWDLRKKCKQVSTKYDNDHVNYCHILLGGCDRNSHDHGHKHLLGEMFHQTYMYHKTKCPSQVQSWLYNSNIQIRMWTQQCYLFSMFT